MNANVTIYLLLICVTSSWNDKHSPLNSVWSAGPTSTTYEQDLASHLDGLANSAPKSSFHRLTFQSIVEENESFKDSL